MYLAIDIGGTKTLIAVFDKSGNVIDQYKFATNKVYTEFTAELSGHIAEKFAGHTFLGCCCAVPGQIDQKKGVALHEGNLPWTDSAPIKKDLENLLPHTPVFIENDAKLAGLSEALAHKQSKTVLYLTVSTGIGAGVIVDGKIDPTLSKSEPGQMILEFDGKLDSEIDDPAIWQEFSRALARGLIELIAIVQPDLIIVGGGVGSHFEKFSKPLNEQLAKLANEMVNVPTIIKANKPEEAVIYGCYDLINQKI
jgi:predicted NBD/HSP70 family sugar kinase